MRSLITAVTAAALVVFVVAPAGATPLTPGTTGTFTPTLSLTSGTFLASMTGTFSQGSEVGDIMSMVFDMGGGIERFLYKVDDTSGDVARVTVSGYDGALFSLINAISDPFMMGGGTVVPLTAFYNTNGTAGADFGNTNSTTVNPAQPSSVWFGFDVQANSFRTVNIGVLDSIGTNTSGFAPEVVPEPVTLVLCGLGLAGLALLRRRSVRRA